MRKTAAAQLGLVFEELEAVREELERKIEEAMKLERLALPSFLLLVHKTPTFQTSHITSASQREQIEREELEKEKELQEKRRREEERGEERMSHEEQEKIINSLRKDIQALTGEHQKELEGLKVKLRQEFEEQRSREFQEKMKILEKRER
jgi:hypothetical protein